MAERNPRPANSDKIPWPATTYGTADPSSQRAAGWAPNEIPDNDEFNFLQKMWGEEFVWLASFATREWTTLPEGIAATSHRDLFRVVPVAIGMYSRLQQVFNVACSAATGGNPISICTDGEQIYYIGGTIAQSLIAADPNDGSEIWETSPLTQHASLCCDGYYVYACSTSSGETGLYKINRDTGYSVSSGGTEYNCQSIITNGYYAAGIRPASSTSKLVFWTVGAGAASPTETGTVTITPLNGLAIDADQVYVGGTRATYDVWAYDLATRANQWQITLPTSTAPTVAAITADGNFVYVATDQVALTAGGNASMFCLERISGNLLWTMDLNDLVDVAVDDRYLYAITTSDDLAMIDIHHAAPGIVAVLADVDSVVCDGVSVICHDATTTTNLQRNFSVGASKLFMRSLGDDINRRPFYTLAVPVNGGI